jgi:hypothetical protein
LKKSSYLDTSQSQPIQQNTGVARPQLKLQRQNITHLSLQPFKISHSLTLEASLRPFSFAVQYSTNARNSLTASSCCGGGPRFNQRMRRNDLMLKTTGGGALFSPICSRTKATRGARPSPVQVAPRPRWREPRPLPAPARTPHRTVRLPSAGNPAPADGNERSDLAEIREARLHGDRLRRGLHSHRERLQSWGSAKWLRTHHTAAPTSWPEESA